MSKEQYEALDEGDFDQNVSQADGHKINQRQRRLAGSSTFPRKGKDKEGHDCADRDNQHQQQHQYSKVHFPVDPFAQATLAQNLGWLEREEKERCIVTDRRNVVPVTARKSVRIVADNQIRKRIVPSLRGKVERIEF